jgi:hypothetical protein
MQGFKDLSMEGGRFKQWTDAETNSVILGVENLKQDDEGLYKCILNNGGEEVTHEFNLYVTGKDKAVKTMWYSAHHAAVALFS